MPSPFFSSRTETASTLVSSLNLPFDTLKSEGAAMINFEFSLNIKVGLKGAGTINFPRACRLTVPCKESFGFKGLTLTEYGVFLHDPDCFMSSDNLALRTIPKGEATLSWASIFKVFGEHSTPRLLLLTSSSLGHCIPSLSGKRISRFSMIKHPSLL